VSSSEIMCNHQSKRNFIQNLVLSKVFWSIFFILGFSIPILKSYFRPLPPDLPKYFQVPEFSLTNGFNENYGSENLKGRVYFANFMFTSCPATCPKLMKKVQLIQKRLRGLREQVGIISISVDPENDTPKKLLKYSMDMKANPEIWQFLTGKISEIENLLMKGFKVPSVSSSSPMDIVHSEKMVLVDQEGMVRGYYSFSDHDINKLLIDIGLLVNKDTFKGKGLLRTHFFNDKSKEKKLKEVDSSFSKEKA
jgi:protein SCO1